MERQSEELAPNPRCSLFLRIHSSILQSVEEGEPSDGDPGEHDILLLPEDIVLGAVAPEDIGDGATEFQSTKHHNPHDGHVYTREENAGTSHVFRMTETISREQGTSHDGTSTSGNRFDFVTSIGSAQRIVVQPSADKLKDLGKRARARTEQERQNRKGIKIFDDSALVAEQTQKQQQGMKSTSLSISKSIANASLSNAAGIKKRQSQQQQQQQKRRRRNSQAQQPRSAKTKRKSGQTLLWTPDLSQMKVPFEDDEQSAYVQLHGLPVGSTLQIVRKFFAGLVPERILVLLGNRRDIWELDASYDDLPSFGRAIYTNNDVRVLVKFNSVSASRLAVERSGETILSKHLNIDGGPIRRQRIAAEELPDEFSIGVTQVSKELSSCLSKLSIDATPGIPFDECLFRVESKLDPIIRGILWSSTAKECRVAVDSKIQRCKIFMEKDDGADDDTTVNEQDFLSFAGYRNHAKHHNRLLRIYEDLIGSIPIDGSADATQSSDPLVRLTAHACSVLEDEMDRIDMVLHQYRVSRFR